MTGIRFHRKLKTALLSATSVLVLAGVALFFCDRLGRSQSPNEVTISCRNGDVVRFQLVQGTSNIPLDYVLRERNPSTKQKRDPVSIPTFWIAEELVTEGLFADVMGRPVREGPSADRFFPTSSGRKRSSFVGNSPSSIPDRCRRAVSRLSRRTWSGPMRWTSSADRPPL